MKTIFSQSVTTLKFKHYNSSQESSTQVEPLPSLPIAA